MSKMERIRRNYRVSAKRGARIKFRGEPGVISGTPRDGSLHMYVRMDTGEHLRVHPTWEMEYLNVLQIGSRSEDMGEQVAAEALPEPLPPVSGVNPSP